MLYTGIAVVILALALIFFVTFAVYWVSQNVSAGIRDKSAEILSAYSNVIEEKSKELQRLNRELEEARKNRETEKKLAETKPAVKNDTNGNSVGIVDRLNSSSYVDPTFTENYKIVRQGFNVDPIKVLNELNLTNQGVGPAEKLLEELSYDSIYKLSALSSDEQQSVLEELLGDAYKELLDGYMAEAKVFSALDFYDYIKTASVTEPSVIMLRVPENFVLRELPKNVKIVVDNTICEGFQIEANNTLYDYCVKEREIK